jgi:hypothetical protein
MAHEAAGGGAGVPAGVYGAGHGTPHTVRTHAQCSQCMHVARQLTTTEMFAHVLLVCQAAGKGPG